MAYETGVIRELVSNREPHADYAALAYRQTFFNDATTTDKAASANGDITVQNGPSRNVTVVINDCIVFDQGAAVDDAIVTYPGTGIDDGPVHDNAARAN